MSLKFVYHNTTEVKDADWVLVGVPNEEGNFSNRQGTSRGPNAIRKASQERLSFIRQGERHCIVPEREAFRVKLSDAGDIEKKKIGEIIKNLGKNQRSIMLGGDHSNTFLALQGLQQKYKEIAVIYLDAHPDMVGSFKPYYGSVVYDILKLPHVNKTKVIEVGIRSIEQEERWQLHTKKIKSYTALDVYEQGIQRVFSEVKRKIGNTPLYLSIDLDVIDPAFAPGVDTPASFGLLPQEFLWFVKQCATLNLVSFDVMEMSPTYDIQQRTAQLAAQTIVEIVASAVKRKK